jgi:hypothetical protein
MRLHVALVASGGEQEDVGQRQRARHVESDEVLALLGVSGECGDAQKFARAIRCRHSWPVATRTMNRAPTTTAMPVAAMIRRGEALRALGLDGLDDAAGRRVRADRLDRAHRLRIGGCDLVVPGISR